MTKEDGFTVPAEQFVRWLERHGLSERAAVEVLGISRPTIAGYRQKGAPQMVAMAMDAFDLYDAAAEELERVARNHVGDVAALRTMAARVLDGRGMIGERVDRVLAALQHRTGRSRDPVSPNLNLIFEMLGTSVINGGLR
jgi:hypothetical protein